MKGLHEKQKAPCISLNSISITGGIRAITQGSRSADPVEAAETFKQSFVKDYGEDGPQWVTVGWQAATARAHGQYKFLFVYLHSQYHQVPTSY